MPVKVRCPGCQKVLNAPDKARGKSLKCPNCEGRIRVPAGKAAAPAKKKRTRRPADSEEFLGGVNLDRMEDRSANVCLKCGANVSEGDEVCGECGIDLATGKVRVKRKGPDPSLFYREAWSDSWKFMLENKKLALFTGAVWTLFMVLYVGGAAATGALHTWETENALVADKEQREDAAKIKPKPGQEPKKWADITRGQAAIKALTKPPVMILFFVTILMALGGLGWYWHVSSKVIEQTMRKKKQYEMRKVQFDFFQTVILGFKAFSWPSVLLMPVFFFASFVIIPLGIAGSLVFGSLGALGVSLIWIGMNMIPLFVFPIAQVHMTMPYTFRAFLPWDMLRIFFRNVAPALYWLVMLVAVVSPVIVTTVVLLLFAPNIDPMGSVDKIVAAMLGDDATTGFAFKATKFGVSTGLLAATTAAFMIPLAFAALFLMRANGLLGYYNRRTLELVTRQKPDIPCGFWVRYLAAMIDGLLILMGMIGLYVAFDMAAVGLSLIGREVPLTTRLLALLGIFIVVPMYYFIKSESGIFQGTLGKRSLGIKVTNLKGKSITMNQALGRYWGKLISTILFGGGFIMAGFTEQKQALHDRMVKAVVVWEGDDDRS